MKDQLSEKERKLYEQGLNNVTILRTRSDITRILFMVVINLVLAIGTTIFPMKISIALVMIISLVFYFIDLYGFQALLGVKILLREYPSSSLIFD